MVWYGIRPIPYGIIPILYGIWYYPRLVPTLIHPHIAGVGQPAGPPRPFAGVGLEGTLTPDS